MKKLVTTVAWGLILSVSAVVNAETVNFTAADIKAAMVAAGAPLSNGANQWGLWAVRAMPIVGGAGTYTITAGVTSQTGWGVAAPNGAFGAPPYTATNSVWFYDESGAEVAGTPANPLYMIMDVPECNFYSTGFDKTGAPVADWAPGPDCAAGTGDDLGTFYASGYDGGFGGTNVVTAVANASTFSFSFTLDAGATWSGKWQFVVDGSKYAPLGTPAAPGAWVGNFFGGYIQPNYDGSGDKPGGGLMGNMGAGYVVTPPEPVCGNNIVEPLGNEECDPPGSAGCPSGSYCALNCRCVEGIPAVSEWGLAVLTLIGLVSGTILFSRRRVAVR